MTNTFVEGDGGVVDFFETANAGPEADALYRLSDFCWNSSWRGGTNGHLLLLFIFGTPVGVFECLMGCGDGVLHELRHASLFLTTSQYFRNA